MKKRNKVLLYIFSIAGLLTGLFFIWNYSIAVIIMAGIIFLPGLYVYRKAIKVYTGKKFKRILLWAVLLLSFAFPIGFFGINLTAQFKNSVIVEYLLIIGQVYLPAIHFIFITALSISLIAFVGKLLKFVKKEKLEQPNVKKAAFWFTVVLAGVLLAISYRNHTETEINLYSIELSKKSSNLDSLRIVIVSDIHLTQTTPDYWLNDRVVMINSLDPDIVLIPGDLIDSRADLMENKPFVDDLKAIKSKYGVYASTGNHEHYGGFAENYNYIAGAGITLLADSAVCIDSSFCLAGRLDRSQKHRKNLGEILTPNMHNMPVILMDHQPHNLNEAQENSIDKHVSCHTHNVLIFPCNHSKK